jgi:hypothetical protein
MKANLKECFESSAKELESRDKDVRDLVGSKLGDQLTAKKEETFC